MVKHTQTIRRPTSCLSVFDHFVGLALKGLSDVPISEDEEDVSYDVEGLFTNIFIKDTIDVICKEIYVLEKLEPIFKESIFKKLLYKLKTECTFNTAEKLRKQVDGICKGNKMLVTPSDCFMKRYFITIKTKSVPTIR